jgi:Tfp pilus assembly protein PilO
MNTQNIKAAVLKHRVASVSIVVAVVLAGVWFLRHGTLGEVESRLDTERQQSQRLTANVSNAALLEEHLKAIQDAQKAIESRLVSPAILGDNQAYFYKIGTEAGIKFLDLRQNLVTAGKAPKTTGSYVPVSFTVSLRGSYANILAFLRHLENGSAFSRIVSGTVSPASQGDEKNKVEEINLNLTVELLGRS